MCSLNLYVDINPTNKQTCLQGKVHRQSNQTLMWATKKRHPLSKRSWDQLSEIMSITFLAGQRK